MKRTTKLLVLAAGAALLGAGSTWAAGAASPAAAPAATKPVKPSDLFPDTVVAKGKGVEIKRSQLEEEVIRLKAQAAAHGQQIPPEQMPMWEQRILQDLIGAQLLGSKATPEEKVAAKKLAEERMGEAKTQLGSEEALNRQLKAIDMTREQLLAKWVDAATADAVRKRELKVNITDDDVKKFYDENPSKFEQPEMVRASHILLMTIDPQTKAELSKEQKEAKHKQMEGILKRARAGEDFAKLAKEFSEDPGSKDNGGEYTFPRGRMVPEFEAAAFSLNTNQISEIVTTQYGYHIIKLSEKMPAKKVELAKVAKDVKEGLVQQEIGKLFPPYYEKLKKDADIQILDERLKPRENPADMPAGHPPITPSAKPDAKK